MDNVYTVRGSAVVAKAGNDAAMAGDPVDGTVGVVAALATASAV